MRTFAYVALVMLVLSAQIGHAGTRAVPTVAGAKIARLRTPYPSESVPVPGALLTRWNNGSVTERDLIVDNGTVRLKTEADKTVDQLKAVVYAEVDATTESGIYGGFTATVAGDTYTFACRVADQSNKSSMMDDMQAEQLDFPVKVRLLNAKKSGSFSKAIAAQAGLKSYAKAMRLHVQKWQEGGWNLKEGLEAATTREQVLSVREVNNARQ